MACYSHALGCIAAHAPDDPIDIGQTQLEGITRELLFNFGWPSLLISSAGYAIWKRHDTRGF